MSSTVCVCFCSFLLPFYRHILICRINSPSTVLTTYISEFHDSQSRPRLFMIIGIFVSMAALVLPILGLFILPQDWELIATDHFYSK